MLAIHEIRATKKDIDIILVGEAEQMTEYQVQVKRPFGLQKLAVFTPTLIDDTEATEGNKVCLRCPRIYENQDLLTARFDVFVKDWNQGAGSTTQEEVCKEEEHIGDASIIPGPCYVTKLMGIAVQTVPYPTFPNKKTLSECGEDYQALDIHQTVINISLPAIMAVHTQEETISFEMDGDKYLFLKNRIDALDDFFKKRKAQGIYVTAILLNAPRLFDSTGEKELLDRCIHPDFAYDDKTAFISAFSMKTISGQKYYRAFVEFLCARYAGSMEDRNSLVGMIVSNEVDSQYIWGNAGEKTCAEYMEEYTQTLRMTYLVGRKYRSSMRVYISMDHFFNIRFDETKPLRYYTGREVLECLNAQAKEDGDFDWSVAYHCYPEDLRHPDFYNDRTADYAFSTQRITFKNIEILPLFLAQERFLYEGKERRIILSEQGFNSTDTPLSLKQGAAAYVLAYEKIKAIPTIDMMMHHAYVDNLYEFGLHLGIRRCLQDGSVGEPRPIYECMKDMGTNQEAARILEAKAFIGEDLFEEVLHPTLLAADDESAGSMEFQEPEKE